MLLQIVADRASSGHQERRHCFMQSMHRGKYPPSVQYAGRLAATLSPDSLATNGLIGAVLRDEISLLPCPSLLGLPLGGNAFAEAPLATGLHVIDALLVLG